MVTVCALFRRRGNSKTAPKKKEPGQGPVAWTWWDRLGYRKASATGAKYPSKKSLDNFTWLALVVTLAGKNQSD